MIFRQHLHIYLIVFDVYKYLLFAIFFICGSHGLTWAQEPKTLYDLYCKDQVPRKDKVTDDNVKDPIIRGLNADLYIKSQPYHDQILLENLSLQTLDDWRREKFKEKLDEFLSAGTNETSWSVDNLRPLIDSESDLYNNLTERQGIISRFVVLYNHKAYVDCRAKTYNYEVSFWILKNSLMVFPEQVRRPIRAAVDSLLEPKFQRLRREPSISINLYNDLFRAILDDAVLRHKVGKALRDAGIDLEILQYFDPGTRSLFDGILGTKPISPFGSGKYTLTGDLFFLIETIVTRFLVLRDHGRRYKIVSKGFADANPIRPNPGYIQYDGNADLGKKIDQEVLYSESVQSHYDKITSNDQLSIARGCAGAEFIKRILTASLRGEELRSIEVYYAGGGVFPGTPQDIYRRIDITISKMNR